jgi:nucleoside phosphorylase
MSGGVELLKRIHRGGDVTPPEYIFGLTANLEAMEVSREEFASRSWQLEEVGATKTSWKLKLMEKLRYLKAREEYHLLEADKTSNQKAEKYDVLLVCALQDPELSALLKATGNDWKVVTYAGDPHLYWQSELKWGTKTIRAVALCLPQMGLVAAGVSVSKAVTLFKPSVVAMSGICAGRKGDCNLGDAIGVNLTWDYGSGKFTDVDGAVVFEPAPFQAPASARVVSVLTEIRSNPAEIENIYRESPGYRPPDVPEFHVAPMGSGAAVQNHKEFFSGVATQQRKILGVDMEAFAVAWAAHEALEPQPHWLVIKSVVDFADGTKNSEIQGFGSYFSARLLRLALEKLFAK